MHTWSRVALAAASFALLGGCGTGGVHVDPIFRGVVGPGGGTVAAGPVTLVLVPGALTQDTVVEILPQPTPLPMDPAAGTIQQLDLHCIGPVGLDLAQPSVVRFCYETSLIPFGFTQADLVLLIWDDAAGFFRVEASATHDLAARCFELTTYLELGHVGLGVPIDGPLPPPFDFFFFGAPFAAISAQGVQLSGALTLAATQPNQEGEPAPLQLEASADASLWVPSRDGSRIAFQIDVPEQESAELWSVDTSDPYDARLLRGTGEYSSSDGLWGWHADQDFVFFERSFFDESEESFANAYSTVPGDEDDSDDRRTRTDDSFLFDVRFSPDHSKVLLAWGQFSKGFFVTIDVVDTTTNTLIGADILQYFFPFFGGVHTPRWLPDSSGIYFVEPDGGTTVTQMSPDGLTSSTLYTLPVLNSYIKDFVVATPFEGVPPECAYVRHDFGLAQEMLTTNGRLGAPTDFFVFDDVAGGDYSETDLGGEFAVVELVPAYSDGFGTALTLLQLEEEFFSKGGITVPPDGRTLVFSGSSLVHDWRVPLTNVDLQHSTGRFLVTVPTNDDGDLDFPTRGIYACDPSGNEPVDVTPPGWDFDGPARWLLSWRHTPGIFTSEVR